MRERAKAGAFLLVIFLVSGYANGQQEQPFFTTSPPNPVGSGARAMGVGGAFIAVGDDATAASWNPGCLIQLEKPEASYVLTEDIRSIDGDNVSFFDVNYLSAAYPFTLKKNKPLFGQNNINMILSLNYQRLFDFYNDFAGNYSPPPDIQEIGQLLAEGGIPEENIYTLTDNILDNDYKLKNKQTGDLGALSPAFAIQITPKFSLGFTYNFWRDGWMGKRQSQQYSQVAHTVSSATNWAYGDADANCTCNGGQPCTDVNYNVDNPSCFDTLLAGPIFSGTVTTDSKIDIDTTMRMEGQNFNLGMLWDINGRWSLGAVYRSRIKMDVERTLKTALYIPSQPVQKGETKYDDNVYFPSSFGIGAGYRFSDALSFTADVTRVNWNEYIYDPEGGTRFNLVNGLKTSKAGVDPTYTARAGAEYLIIKPKYVVPIRGGFFYDPEPAKGRPDNVYGITIGTGFAYKKVALDLTYYYRWGNDIILLSQSDSEHENLKYVRRGDLQQHMVMFSTIVYFE